MCDRDQLLKTYGSSIVRLSSANSYSYEKRDITFRKYAEDMMGPQKLETLANGETLCPITAFFYNIHNS